MGLKKYAVLTVLSLLLCLTGCLEETEEKKDIDIEPESVLEPFNIITKFD